MSKFVTFSLTLAFLVGNFFKPSLISPDIRISVSDLVIFSIWVLALISNFKSILFILKSHPLIKPLVLFVIIALASLAIYGRTYGHIPLLVGLLYLIRWEFYVLLFVPLTIFMTARQSQRILIYLGVALIATSIVQYFFLPNLRPLTALDWDPHYFRVVGSLLDPGFMGILLVFTLLIFTSPTQPFPLFHSFKWALSYMVLAFTYSRSSFFAFISGFTIISLFKKSWRYFFSSLLLLTITIALLPRISDGEGVKLERTSTIQARLTNWGNSLTIFRDHFLTGVGFNTYRYAQKSYGFISGPQWQTSHAGAGADSSILFVAATTGIFGLLAYIWYLASLWKFSKLNIPFRAGLVALFIHSWFLNSLFYPFVLIWISLWIVSSSRVKSHQ